MLENGFSNRSSGERLWIMDGGRKAGRRGPPGELLASDRLARAQRQSNGQQERARARGSRRRRTAAMCRTARRGRLRSTRTRLVGAIIPTLDHAIYATMVDGLQARLAEKGVSLIINTSTYDIDLEYEQAKLLVERGAESVVLVGAHASAADARHARAASALPMSSPIPPVRPRAGAAVGFDNEKAGRDGGPLSARSRPYAGSA